MGVLNEKRCNKSFASHPKSVLWHSENDCYPKEVLKGCEKKFYFNCEKCPHKLYISLKKISLQGRWCSYCSHQKLCENIDCNMCYNNSFASIERCKYLFDKTINPRMLFKSSNCKKYKFLCDKCSNSFDKILSDVTRGIWCPNCVNKTEEKLYNELTKHYIVQRQFKTIWCKNSKTNRYLPYDFKIQDLNIIVEQDGPQHFKQIGKWQSPELTKNNDIYKMKCANENGYSVIRLLQKIYGKINIIGYKNYLIILIKLYLIKEFKIFICVKMMNIKILILVLFNFITGKHKNFFFIDLLDLILKVVEGSPAQLLTNSMVPH